MLMIGGEVKRDRIIQIIFQRLGYLIRIQI